MAEAKVTLAHKKNLRDAEAKKPALLAKLKAATGVDFELGAYPSFDDFALALIKSNHINNLVLGDALYKEDGHFAAIVTFFEKSCQDEMIKEALVAAITTKKILLRLVENWDDSKIIEIQDGTMYVNTNLRKFYTYMGDYAKFDITPQL